MRFPIPLVPLPARSLHWPIVLVETLLLASCGPASSGDGTSSSASDGASAAGSVWSPDGACGSGTWQPGTLEIHHLALGQADATLVVSPTGRTLLIDAGEPRWDRSTGAEAIGQAVRAIVGCSRLDAMLITHFHTDHVGAVGFGGLWHLSQRQGFQIGRTLHRDVVGFAGEGGTVFRGWRSYLSGEGKLFLNPQVARLGATIDLGPGVVVQIIALDGDGVLRRGDHGRDPTPPSENDYSVAARLRFGRLDYFIAGDLSGEGVVPARYGPRYHDIETGLAARVGDVDVYRVSHHGSAHSSGPAFLAQMNPRVSIISVGDDNPFGHPWPETLDRLSARGRVYLTQRGAGRARLGSVRAVGSVVLRTRDGETFSVNGDSFVAADPPRVDRDGDGYFREVDPDDADPLLRPALRGVCDPLYRACP